MPFCEAFTLTKLSVCYRMSRICALPFKSINPAGMFFIGNHSVGTFLYRYNLRLYLECFTLDSTILWATYLSSLSRVFHSVFQVRALNTWPVARRAWKLQDAQHPSCHSIIQTLRSHPVTRIQPSKHRQVMSPI